MTTTQDEWEGWPGKATRESQGFPKRTPLARAQVSPVSTARFDTTKGRSE
ncbi:MAG TPA: hypothetical protein VKU80_19245 [Planctomycetota bacterium]|nr:hypothetical protein [Planctomycetota bacterium]